MSSIFLNGTVRHKRGIHAVKFGRVTLDSEPSESDRILAADGAKNGRAYGRCIQERERCRYTCTACEISHFFANGALFFINSDLLPRPDFGGRFLPLRFQL